MDTCQDQERVLLGGPEQYAWPIPSIPMDGFCDKGNSCSPNEGGVHHPLGALLSYFETVLVLSCDFIYFIYVTCLGKLFIGDWRRRHVGSVSYKEEGCREKRS